MIHFKNGFINLNFEKLISLGNRLGSSGQEHWTHWDVWLILRKVLSTLTLKYSFLQGTNLNHAHRSTGSIEMLTRVNVPTSPMLLCAGPKPYPFSRNNYNMYSQLLRVISFILPWYHHANYTTLTKMARDNKLRSGRGGGGGGSNKVLSLANMGWLSPDNFLIVKRFLLGLIAAQDGLGGWKPFTFHFSS